MRAISLQQPWASLVAMGAKIYETRSWSTRYRGPIAIHSSAAYPPHLREITLLPAFQEVLFGAGPLPLGCFLAVGEIDNCSQCRPSTHDQVGHPEREFGNFEAGRYRFHFANMRKLQNPIPYLGALSLWAVPPEIEIRLLAQCGDY